MLLNVRINRANPAWEETKPQAATTINLLFYGLFVSLIFVITGAYTITNPGRFQMFTVFCFCRDWEGEATYPQFASLRLRGRSGWDGCQSALWGCFGGRICRHVEYASPKTVPQSTLTTISSRLPRKLKEANIGPLQLVIHVVQNRHTGEQETHWEKTNKGNYRFKWYKLFVNLSCPNTCSPAWRFCTTWITSWKGPIFNLLTVKIMNL